VDPATSRTCVPLAVLGMNCAHTMGWCRKG
jgi:hypothetical protein